MSKSAVKSLSPDPSGNLSYIFLFIFFVFGAIKTPSQGQIQMLLKGIIHVLLTLFTVIWVYFELSSGDFERFCAFAVCVWWRKNSGRYQCLCLELFIFHCCHENPWLSAEYLILMNFLCPWSNVFSSLFL